MDIDSFERRSSVKTKADTHDFRLTSTIRLMSVAGDALGRPVAPPRPWWVTVRTALGGTFSSQTGGKFVNARGTVEHRVYFDDGYLYYEVLGRGTGDYPRTNVVVGVSEFRRGVYRAILKYGDR